ncbi:hypothetical protein ACFWWB_29785 [Streptomyces sp. NPDC058690]|uniref:hypothetical protein n=1 Tax=Streptomyces sp. NPDC058690 TaxID=3346600 RepID=UPI0036617DCD
MLAALEGRSADLDEEERRTRQREVVGAVQEFWNGALTQGARFFIGLVWALIILGQAGITVVCGGWLTVPRHEPNESPAAAILSILALGLSAVAIFPFIRLQLAPVRPLVQAYMRKKLEQRLNEETPEADRSAA